MYNLLEQTPLQDSFADGMERWLQDTETFPTASPTAEEDETTTMDIVSKVLSNTFLFFLIFGLSATVDIKDLKRQLSNKFAIACGVGMQFLIMPFLGFLAVISLRDSGLTEAMGITLLVVTASPGGSYSNWWCSTFNADLALSVAMTTVSSILSIGLLPANLFLYTYLAYGVTDGDEESVVQALDFGTLFITLGIVMSAIALGLYAGYTWDYPWFHVCANRFGGVCGILLILSSVFLASGADGAESNFWSQPWAFYVGVAFPCLVGIAVANVIARSVRLSPPETVAISIECCYQNTGIATSVAITMFSDKEERAQAVAVPLFYGIIEAVVIGIYCVWAWKVGWTKAPADEKFCVVISKTYEVSEEDEDDGEGKDEDKTRTDHVNEEPELDPEALGVVLEPVAADKSITDEKAEHSGESAAAGTKTEPEITGSGFWTRVRQFFSSNAGACGEPKDEECPEYDEFKTPARPTEEPRERFYTAETTGETSMYSSSPSPRSLHVSLCRVQEAELHDSPEPVPPAPPLDVPEEDAPVPAIELTIPSSDDAELPEVE